MHATSQHESAWTEAEDELHELDVLEQELSQLAMREGITLPAAEHEPAARHSNHAALAQLMQQQTRFLEVLQGLLAETGRNADAGAAPPAASSTPQHSRQQAVSAVAAASAAAFSAGGAAAEAESGVEPRQHAGAPADVTAAAQLRALQAEHARHVAETRALKQRCVKAQHALVRHLEAARQQASVAAAERDAALKREQDAMSAADALKQQLSAQQQALAAVQQQVASIKSLHKQRLARHKAQLRQQHEVQLAVLTSAYAQELGQLQQVGDVAIKHANDASLRHSPYTAFLCVLVVRSAGAAGARVHASQHAGSWQHPAAAAAAAAS